MKNFSVGLLSIVMLMACCITNSMGDEVITIGQRKLGDEIVFAVSDRTESTPQPSEKTLKFYSQYVRPTYFTITVKPVSFKLQLNNHWEQLFSHKFSS